MKKKQKV